MIDQDGKQRRPGARATSGRRAGPAELLGGRAFSRSARILTGGCRRAVVPIALLAISSLRLLTFDRNAQLGCLPEDCGCWPLQTIGDGFEGLRRRGKLNQFALFFE